MVNLESNRLPVSKEVTYDHPLFLRGASLEEITQILGATSSIDNTKTEEQKSIIFAQGLWENGLIGEDLTYWNKLQELYRGNKRKLPENFAVRLRLEVFFRARTGVERGDYDSLDRFFYIGKSIDHEWFSKSNSNTYKDEQGFIKDELNKGKNTINGNNPGVADIARKLEKERFDVYAGELASLGTVDSEGKT